MQRRHLIQRMATAGLLLPGLIGGFNLRAYAQRAGISPFMRPHVEGDDRVLVILRLMGGNDGLNTFVPYHDDRYYEARGGTKGIDISVPSEKVLKLDDSGTMGFNPALAPIHELYQEGKVAVVQNIGYDGQNLSHFRSSDIWLSGTDSDVVGEAGWFGRYLETIHPEYPAQLPDDPYAIELGTVLSSALVGDRGAMGITLNEIDFIPDVPPDGAPPAGESAMLEEYMRQTMRQTNHFSHSISKALAARPSTVVEYDHANQFQHHLSTVARLIASGSRTKLYIVNLENYDFHFAQKGREQTMHSLFSAGVRAFQRDLEALALDHRVLMTTISEFGRRVVSGGDGTDHGGASMLFVMGTPVLGGIVGRDPDIANVDASGNLKHEYDFRQLYATILGEWFGASRSDIESRALPRWFDHLPLLRPDISLGHDASPESGKITLGLPTPNPASSQVRIPCRLIEGGGAAEVVVTTIDGRVVGRESIPLYRGHSVVVLDVRGYAPGGYFCMVRQKNYSANRKIVVVR